MVSDSPIFNCECDAIDLKTSKLNKVKIIQFNMVLIDFSYSISYRLLVVTFALGRTV